MKHLKDQQGYALLVVLLMVVLFLSISATFMAGSLSNAKQEQTVDTSNQSVASAEMGVKYFSSDFQREMGLIEEEVWRVTQEKVNEIIVCASTTACDEESEILARTTLLNTDMKEKYIDSILTKVDDLYSMKDTEISPFAGDPIKYSIVAASAEKLDAAGAPAVDYADTASIRVNLDMTGTSKEVTKELSAFFTIEVPDTYLDTQELLVVKTVARDNLTFDDIFKEQWPDAQCTAELLATIAAGDHEGLKECTLAADQTVTEFIALIKEANLDPEDFRVYASNFENNVCNENCKDRKSVV